MTMFHAGKCPGCQKRVSAVSMERVQISEGIGGPRWNGVNLLCPSCRTILGATFDPQALQTDIVKLIVAQLR
jgi:hypothetical protein